MTEEVNPMYALTLHQPWASLIAVGVKQWETRAWPPARYALGTLLAIHAGKTCDIDMLMDQYVVDALGNDEGRLYAADLPAGEIVAVARLQTFQRTEAVAQYLRPMELHFGDYTPGRYAWSLGDVHKLAKPVPARGAQKLWSVGNPEFSQPLEQAWGEEHYAWGRRLNEAMERQKAEDEEKAR